MTTLIQKFVLYFSFCNVMFTRLDDVFDYAGVFFNICLFVQHKTIPTQIVEQVFCVPFYLVYVESSVTKYHAQLPMISTVYVKHKIVSYQGIQHNVVIPPIRNG